eukprot:TRINITY_DN1198_c1_g3_i1.p1 TRINITY_DN1198_c1_g3~~TRINITY_DN1198_c1_g3_i1.p1  ORF type:complete len:369 (+),score=122.62 TRINITY_DN1198_c1_g3_i1:257-1363(+)
MAGLGDGYVGSSQDSLRIRRLEKQRETDRKRTEDLKRKMMGGQAGLLQFGQGTSEVLESAFKKETVGLVTRDQFVEKRASIRNKMEEEERLKLIKQQEDEDELQLLKRKRRRKKAGTSRLSFAEDLEEEEEDEEEEEEGANGAGAGREGEDGGARAPVDAGNGKEHKGTNGEKKRRGGGLGKLGKDPTVETSFLPDREREAEEQEERERLGHEWRLQQERIKNEALEITYSYWDGAGHRRVIQVRKGDSIGEFLGSVQQQLAAEFREVRTSSVENLLYVKEDLIIPHQYTFYELIINRARGKSGPLFHFDVHEDVRTIADATIEKDESHAGKVVERHWYDKNKHIFPASRWEIYDPTKKWERYTIHGG